MCNSIPVELSLKARDPSPTNNRSIFKSAVLHLNETIEMTTISPIVLQVTVLSILIKI